MSLLGYAIGVISLIILIYFILSKRKTSKEFIAWNFVDTEFRYTVYKSYKSQKPRSLTLIFAGNRIDDLGYKIYSSYRDKLDDVDIYIKDVENDELMKIVTESDFESMIGVTHPEKGHIGYLQYSMVEHN